MPFYEYRCKKCAEKFTILVGVVAQSEELRCPRCGGRRADKLVSRFRRLRSEEDVLENLADPSQIGDLEDPRNLRNWARRLGREMGEDLDDDLDEMLDEEMEKEGGGGGGEDDAAGEDDDDADDLDLDDE